MFKHRKIFILQSQLKPVQSIMILTHCWYSYFLSKPDRSQWSHRSHPIPLRLHCSVAPLA